MGKDLGDELEARIRFDGRQKYDACRETLDAFEGWEGPVATHTVCDVTWAGDGNGPVRTRRVDETGHVEHVRKRRIACVTVNVAGGTRRILPAAFRVVASHETPVSPHCTLVETQHVRRSVRRVYRHRGFRYELAVSVSGSTHKALATAEPEYTLEIELIPDDPSAKRFCCSSHAACSLLMKVLCVDGGPCLSLTSAADSEVAGPGPSAEKPHGT